jgi:hypothetical protein
MAYNFDFRKIAVWFVVVLMWVCVMMMAFSCSAQTWNNFKGIRLVNNSDTTKQLAVQGSLFFDDQLDSLYLYDGTKWINLSRGAFAKPGAFWPLAGNATLLDNVFIDTDAFSAFIGRSELGMGVDATSAFMANDVGDAISIYHSGGLEILGSGNIDISTNNGQIQILADNNITLNTFGTTQIGNGPIELIGLPSASPSDHIVMIGSGDNILTRSNISLTSGTYTPTFPTRSANCNLPVVSNVMYTRIGRVVQLSFHVNVTINNGGSPTVATFEMTLPIATTTGQSCVGAQMVNSISSTGNIKPAGAFIVNTGFGVNLEIGMDVSGASLPDSGAFDMIITYTTP